MKLSVFTRLRRYRWYLLGRFKIKSQIKEYRRKGKVKIILGAGPSVDNGWISTDIPHFDILKENNWSYLFGGVQADNLLAEHVLEHFTKEDVSHVLSYAYEYLAPNGCLRIAVPDGYHTDAKYLRYVSPPADDHQSLWNIESLTQLLTEKGFRIVAFEYYTKEGVFIGNDFDYANGIVHRSRVKQYKNKHNASYSSIIVDAYKQEKA